MRTPDDAGTHARVIGILLYRAAVYIDIILIRRDALSRGDLTIKISDPGGKKLIYHVNIVLYTTLYSVRVDGANPYVHGTSFPLHYTDAREIIRLSSS